MLNLTNVSFNLKVTFCGFPSSLLCGELQKVKVSFSNEGEGSLHKLHLASTNANLLAFDESSSDNEDIKIPDFLKKQLTRFVERVSKISLPNGCLNANDKVESLMWVQGSPKSGTSKENLLFYYESADENPSMRSVVCFELNVFIWTGIFQSFGGEKRNFSPSLSGFVAVSEILESV